MPFNTFNERIKIKVLEAFQEAGFYTVSPVDRVSDIYDQIVLKNLRNIITDTRIMVIKPRPNLLRTNKYI